MSDETKNMIDAATNNDGTAFKASFDAAINQKVGDTLQVQRQDIAQNIFGNIRVPTEEAVSEATDSFDADHPLVRAFGFADEIGMGDWSDQFARLKRDVTRSDIGRLPSNKRPVMLVRFVNDAAAKKAERAVKQFSGVSLGVKRLRKTMPGLKLS